jgi:hypothetical protein
MPRHLHTLLAILLLFSGSYLFGQQVSLKNFDVRSSGASVHLTWGLLGETGVSEYRLYKKLSHESDYSYLATLPATGSTDYSFVDEDIFKESTLVINYELRVVKNGSVYRFYATLSHNTTSAQQTWGSIKAMFQ